MMLERIRSFRRTIGMLVVALGSLGMTTSSTRAAEEKVPVTFSEGHETEGRDRGRPVVLIAAALGVKPDIFREAFSGVTPARNGRPSGEEARANKAALMKVLQPHGITNERLDEVSDYYRYQPQTGGLWPVTPAEAHAVIVDGRVREIVVTKAGSGYSSLPKAIVKGRDVKLEVTLDYGKEFKKNGSIKSIRVAGSAKN